MTGRLKTTKQREVLLPREMNTLLDQFFIHKLRKRCMENFPIIFPRLGKKIGLKYQRLFSVHQEHPDCTGKNVEAVKKKWLNFISAAKPAIRNYTNELTETVVDQSVNMVCYVRHT